MGATPLEGDYLAKEEPVPPQSHEHSIEDLMGKDELVEAVRHLEDVFKTVIVTPPDNDGIRFLPDIFHPDGSVNEEALRERDRRIKAVRARQKNKSDVDDFIWRVGMPLLGALSIGIAVLTRFI